MVIGNSQMRYMDRIFCAKDKQNRIRVCLPGCGIDVGTSVESCTAGEGENPVICVSAGGNDVGKSGSGELFRRFSETLGKIRDTGGAPIVCSILPRLRKSDEWLSKAMGINRRLSLHFERNGWLFVDTWDSFYGMNHLYARDGMHLNLKGVEILLASLERALSHLQDCLV